MTAHLASQAVTHELRQWILEQSQAGHAPQAVLEAMRAAGWSDAVAREALASALQVQMPQDERPAVPARVPLPEPELTGAPLYLDAGDRKVHVLQAMVSPRIVVFGNLLSDEECDQMIALARPRLARSLTVATQTGGEEVNADRTSNGMFFQRGETELVARIEARLARLLNWPMENGEGLQILHYLPGAQYKPHYDYFEPSEPGTPSILRRGGQRVATIVMYLSEPERGGGTTFPDVQLEIAPKRGNAVFFSYDRPHPATRTLHGGAPVLAGEKWIATKWLRQQRFD
ncbi:MAG: 2OG-Fe(II) oxygenase [Ramlibacter sp.]|jgi:prolyl 4-hydroxylase